MEWIGLGKLYSTGDWVVYTREKYSPSPGPRAKNVSPSEHGELYSYEVDKFWIVKEVVSLSSVVLTTRRGKEHVVPATDPRLRKAKFWERIAYRSRFARLVQENDSAVAAS